MGVCEISGSKSGAFFFNLEEILEIGLGSKISESRVREILPWSLL